MNIWKRAAVVVGIVALCFAFDQATKWMAVQWLKGFPGHSLLWDTIRVEYAENTGAWGSLGGNWPREVRFWALSVLPTLVLAGIGWFAIAKSQLSKIEISAYALIVGGGAGNLFDRFVHGYVVDFLWMGIGPVGTNVFNIADTLIMVAFGLILIHAWRTRKDPA